MPINILHQQHFVMAFVPVMLGMHCTKQILLCSKNRTKTEREWAMTLSHTRPRLGNQWSLNFAKRGLPHKRITAYKENKDNDVVARAWLKQWAPTAHTHVEQNQHCLLGGGLPTLNNNSEGRNNGDKLFLDHRKPLTTDFVHCFAFMLENCSNSDLKFCNCLHRLVHCCAFTIIA